MSDDSDISRIADFFRRFAELEARGSSPLYEELSLGVAADAELLTLLSGLPRLKQQPNLLLAASRFVWPRAIRRRTSCSRGESGCVSAASWA